MYLGQYMTLTSLPPGESTAPGHLATQYAQKPQCHPDKIRTGLDPTGDFTPYYQEREGRDGIGNIKAAVFTFHGHGDVTPLHGVPPMIQVGLFDRLPATTPKFGIFGEFGHENPSSNSYGIRPDIRRGDFLSMEIAWFDHWLKGLDSGVATWGTAQVQGTDGRWRITDDWPRGTGGPTRELALGAGTLGAPAAQATGMSKYVEGFYETTSGFAPRTSATFDTGALSAPLELTGQATLDLWVKLKAPDSHLAARLDAFDAAGNAIPVGSTYALRSAQHRDPFVDGRFVQAQGSPAPVGTPFKTTLRFQPTDIVVPAGGHLRLTLAGSVIVNSGLAQLGIPEPLFLGPSQASGVVAPVTILHDAAHRSVLRFETVAPGATYIRPIAR
jgi:predicted acyl esterase